MGLGTFFGKHPYGAAAMMGGSALPLLLANKGVRRGVGNFLGGTSGEFQQTNRYNPEQQGAMSQILQQALAGLQNPSQGFEPIAQDAMKRFQSDTVPSLAERFTSMGEGAQRSSGFQQALGDAGADLSSNLGAQQAQYSLQKQGLLQQLLGQGLTPQFDNNYQQGQPGMLGPLLGLIAKLGGSYMTGGLL